LFVRSAAMKSVVVLAVLVLCAFSAKIPKFHFHAPTGLRDVEYFEQAALPCAYTINYHMLLDMGGDVHEIGKEVNYGRYRAVKEKVSRDDEEVDHYELLRVDIKKSDDKPDSAAEFSFYEYLAASLSECEGNFIDDYKDSDVGLVHNIVEAKLFYTSKNTGVTYNGEVCDEYIVEEGGQYLGKFYANKDNLIVGYWVEESSMNVNMSYSMVAYESDFILPARATGCSTFTKAYQAPEPEPNCPIQQGSAASSSDPYGSATSSTTPAPTPGAASPSAASTIKACATLIFAMMMVAISLF